MKAFAALDPELPLAAVPAYARRVEQLGFDGLHVAETIHDSLAVALLALEHTTRITVRTAVTLAFVRSPTLVAYSAWDLSILSGGRFELGLGSQIRQNIEDRFGMPWTEPRSRMKEYIAALDALFGAFRTGGSLRYEGDHYRLTRMQPYFNPGPERRGDTANLVGRGERWHVRTRRRGGPRRRHPLHELRPRLPSRRRASRVEPRCCRRRTRRRTSDHGFDGHRHR